MSLHSTFISNTTCLALLHNDNVSYILNNPLSTLDKQTLDTPLLYIVNFHCFYVILVFIFVKSLFSMPSNSSSPSDMPESWRTKRPTIEQSSIWSEVIDDERDFRIRKSSLSSLVVIPLLSTLLPSLLPTQLDSPRLWASTLQHRDWQASNLKRIHWEKRVDMELSHFRFCIKISQVREHSLLDERFRLEISILFLILGTVHYF